MTPQSPSPPPNFWRHALGLATGPAGAALTGNLAVASTVHGFDKFFGQDGGPETSLAYAVVGSALTLTGAARYSIDALTGYLLDRPWMRVVAYSSAAGAAAAAVTARPHELASRPAALETLAEPWITARNRITARNGL